MLLSLRTTAMGPFLYRCPNTGFRVQGWVEDDESEDSDDAYEGVAGAALGQSEDRRDSLAETAAGAFMPASSNGTFPPGALFGRLRATL